MKRIASDRRMTDIDQVSSDTAATVMVPVPNKAWQLESVVANIELGRPVQVEWNPTNFPHLVADDFSTLGIVEGVETASRNRCFRWVEALVAVSGRSHCPSLGRTP